MFYYHIQEYSVFHMIFFIFSVCFELFEILKKSKHLKYSLCPENLDKFENTPVSGLGLEHWKWL